MKKIGFLSFGHWSAAPPSQVRSALDSLIQSLELGGTGKTVALSFSVPLQVFDAVGTLKQHLNDRHR